MQLNDADDQWLTRKQTGRRMYAHVHPDFSFAHFDAAVWDGGGGDRPPGDEPIAAEYS